MEVFLTQAQEEGGVMTPILLMWKQAMKKCSNVPQITEQVSEETRNLTQTSRFQLFDLSK